MLTVPGQNWDRKRGKAIGNKIKFCGISGNMFSFLYYFSCFIRNIIKIGSVKRKKWIGKFPFFTGIVFLSFFILKSKVSQTLNTLNSNEKKRTEKKKNKKS